MLTQAEGGASVPGDRASVLNRAIRIEWLGQTLASLSWITSVFAYGISTTGDWLQLIAGCAWLVANIAALTKPDNADKTNGGPARTRA